MCTGLGNLADISLGLNLLRHVSLICYRITR